MRARRIIFSAIVAFAAVTASSASFANTPSDNEEMMMVATGHDRVGRNANAFGGGASPAGYSNRYDYPVKQHPCTRIGRNFC